MTGTLAEKWLAGGEAKGQVELLLELLERRFGELPTDIRYRIRGSGPRRERFCTRRLWTTFSRRGRGSIDA
ncbi:MAG: hypothetical protein OXC26_15825 [Albidovulum sp.]|nr:hypothetical protein [Albidovulum sp.]